MKLTRQQARDVAESPAETLALCETLAALLEKATTPLPWAKQNGHFQHVTGADIDLFIKAVNALPALLRAAREGVEARNKALEEARQVCLTTGLSTKFEPYKGDDYTIAEGIALKHADDLAAAIDALKAPK